MSKHVSNVFKHPHLSTTNAPSIYISRCLYAYFVKEATEHTHHLVPKHNVRKDNVSLVSLFIFDDLD